jgi:hypothetical protein
MKFFRLKYLLPLIALGCSASKQIGQQPPAPLEKSLLWEISGKGLEKPSYLFGTMHLICEDDAVLSDSLKGAIQNTERVYFEVDMDNLMEMLLIMTKMKMKNDTTLADLLNKEDYEKVKNYIENHNGLIPFSEFEKYKPLLASSLLMEAGLDCSSTVAMEQLIMQEAKSKRKRIEGLETMNYQVSIFDSIPYRLQAEQLLKYIQSQDDRSDAGKEFNEMMDAYRTQDIEKLGKFITKSDYGLMQYEDMLLYQRNRNWVAKLKTIMHDRPVTIAVGAGHLPGEKGVINLLRKEGYTVRAINNKVSSKRVI